MDPNTGLCIKCGGEMYNNTEKNIQRVLDGLKPMPQYACKKDSSHVVWPPRGTTPQQVSSYRKEPSFTREKIPDPKVDWDAIAEGKVRSLFMQAQIQYGGIESLDEAKVYKILWATQIAMTGKLPE